MNTAFTTLDAVVLVAYLLGVTALGIALGRRQQGSGDYFLAGRELPAWVVCASIVATETSALTFISLPATAYTSDFWILQLAIGYIIGRFAVAALLLPDYFRGALTTAYELLEKRFGLPTRRFASIIFLVTRAFADSVRIFAAAIPIALITGWPYWQAILIAGLLTLVYTYVGGLRAVVWADVVQFALYIFGGIAALLVLLGRVPGGWESVRVVASDAFTMFHLEGGWGGFSRANWLWTGLIGGAFLSMASHGADHLIVQRLLSARSLRAAQAAVIGSGIVVFAQFVLFLMIGAALLVYYEGRTFDPVDEVFPRFILEGLPAGLSGLLLAGILAAMMSTVSSSLNALASATTYDIYAPLVRQTDERSLLRIGRVFTLLWAAILVGGSVLFRFASQGTPIVVIALQIASFTYGGLLGAYLLAIIDRRADGTDAMTGMAVAIILMSALWALQQFGAVPRLFDGLWFAFLGSTVAVVTGIASARIRGSNAT